ncbi:hypothetical protein L218DRAFT_514 [Marasmius fiardii PR-910]|nr:hypothetical protein L218DRAFT_514 [Marasmius fiardii PR-910]
MKLPDNVFNSISASFLPKQTTPYGEITTTTESQYIYSATHYEHGDYSDNISSQAPSSARTTHTESQRRQIDLLARLRIIEQLQSFSLPRFRSSIPDDLVTDILNWLTLCFCPNPTSDDVSVALAIYSGEIRMFVGNTPGSPSLSSLQHTKNIFKTALKQVLRGDRASDESPSANLVPPPGMSTPAASRLFLRMVVDIGWKRIQRKLNLLCHTSGEGPEQTGLRFVLLVQSWLFYRPDGERSKAFVNKAISRCGDVAGATDYMIQSFWIILNQAGKNLDEMGDEQRFRYLGSMMTACEMFVKSTFFEDLVSHHTFQITLKQADHSSTPSSDDFPRSHHTKPEPRNSRLSEFLLYRKSLGNPVSERSWRMSQREGSCLS